MESKAKNGRFFVQMMNFPVKLMELPMNMMKLPVNMMVSGMNAVTESMQEMQRKSEVCMEPEDAEETEGGQGSAFRKISNSAMTPYLELFKLPRNVFVSSMKSIAETMEDIRKQPASRNGAVKRETGEKGAGAAVPLTSQEVALESDSVLTEEAEHVPRTVLWQIGRPGRPDFKGKWTEVFDYQVGTDLEPVDSPGIPHFITAKGGPKTTGATEKLNIRFSLERDYANGELALIFDRWGAEKGQVEVDGKLLAAIRGAGKGKFRHVALSLPGLSSGDHVITMTSSGETEAGGHRLDYLKLTASKELGARADKK